MDNSVICYYIMSIAMVFMKSHYKCFQERELTFFCYLKFGVSSQGKSVILGSDIYMSFLSVLSKKYFLYVIYLHCYVYNIAQLY